MAATNRGYSNSNFAFELEGQFAGYIRKADIGKLKGEVATNNLGPLLRQKKQITKMSWDKITFECGVSHSGALATWMQETFKNNHVRKNGAIIMYDHNMNAMRRADFTDAHLIEIGMPTFDAKGKDALYFNLSLQPETIRFTDGGGKINPTVGTKQKLHQNTNFRISIPGIDSKFVSKIELPKYTLKVVEHAVGEFLESQYEPAAVEVGDLKITMSAHEYKKLYDDAHKFLTLGNRSEEAEKSIILDILGPDGKEETISFTFENCGYKELQMVEPLEAHSEKVATTVVTYYTENVVMDIKAKNL
jgi:T4-like virus tail tube protein gp19/Hemolysin coregulated protein Hcp (TssD)